MQYKHAIIPRCVLCALLIALKNVCALRAMQDAWAKQVCSSSGITPLLQSGQSLQVQASWFASAQWWLPIALHRAPLQGPHSRMYFLWSFLILPT